VGYDNRSPQLATQVANELTTLYLQQNSQTRRQQAAEASAFLAEETKRLSQEIATLEAKVADFKQANVDRLPELAALNQQFLNRAEQDLAEVKRQRSVLDERRGYLEAQLAQLSPSRETLAGDSAATLEPADRLRALESYLANVAGVYSDSHPDVVRTRNAIAALRAQLGVADSGADDAEQELADLRTERAGLLTRYEAAHPDVVRLDRKIEAAKQRLEAARAGPAAKPRATNPVYVQLQAQLAGDAAERESLVAKEGELSKKLDELEQRVAQTPVVERDYSALVRDLESARFKYQEVSAKQREAVVSQNLEMDAKAERFNLIEPPLMPERPVSPNRWLIVLLTAVLSIVAAVSGVAASEAFDGSVRGAADFERLLGIAPLGVIPAILTADDRWRGGKRRLQAAAAVAVATVVAIALVHVFVAPIDAIWFGALRRFGA
jgi:polysaccharide biosynthesis transport protein